MYLNSEISKITNANEVFEALAKGFSRYKDILDQSNVSSGPALIDILDKLMRMDVVAKEAPINDENNKKKSEVSFDEPLNVDLDGNELLLSDVLGTDNDEIYKIIEEEIDRNLLFMALDKLSDREKQIMELRFGLSTKGKEKTQKEVANILGISQSYISRLEKKIIFRLKKEMKKFL